MNDIPRRRTLTLVVRVWIEYLEQTPPYWRGEVEVVGGDEKAHFQGFQEITAIIEDHSEQYASPSNAVDHAADVGEDQIP
jgi:hypothetical protein